ncbi:MAG: hypothetical protein IJM30_03775 [Thermoguttaceae bacterium]|nr:hypothetical protein [Thermoguttaceae bacterium]
MTSGRKGIKGLKGRGKPRPVSAFFEGNEYKWNGRFNGFVRFIRTASGRIVPITLTEAKQKAARRVQTNENEQAAQMIGADVARERRNETPLGTYDDVVHVPIKGRRLDIWANSRKNLDALVEEFKPARFKLTAIIFALVNFKIDVWKAYWRAPLGVINMLNRELLRAQKMFGTVGYFKKTLPGDKDLGENDYASYNGADGTVRIRVKLDEESLADKIRFAYNQYLFSTRAPEHVFRHEIGHAVYELASRKNRELFRERENQLRELLYRYRTDRKLRDACLVSNYGSESTREFFAECFASVMNGDQNPLAIKAVNLFKELVE